MRSYKFKNSLFLDYYLCCMIIKGIEYFLIVTKQTIYYILLKNFPLHCLTCLC